VPSSYYRESDGEKGVSGGSVWFESTGRHWFWLTGWLRCGSLP